MIAHSQLAPLPSELPFQIVSKTIGQGAYACIKKARAPNSPQVFAVKFIHKEFALRHGRVTAKQLDMEIALHKHLGQHMHIVSFYHAGDDAAWKWIAMELAEGGDLFDKIEADVGVGEDAAQVYFRQLIAAVSFMHGKGVGHRDIKPENILLSADGNLKIADFGLATLFQHKGQRKLCRSCCGSPPYTAPEVVACTTTPGAPVSTKIPSSITGYYGDLVDIWSCGIVLFVLLVGNTPWDEPNDRSAEFHDYMTTKGRPIGDELWDAIPAEALPLLRGMLCVDPSQRYSLDQVQQHPWFRRDNPHLTPQGGLVDAVALATQMFEKIHIDFSQDPFAPPRGSQSQSQTQLQANEASQSPEAITATPTRDGDAMEVDSPPRNLHKMNGHDEVEAPTAEIAFDWETQPTQSATWSQRPVLLASQPLRSDASTRPSSTPAVDPYLAQTLDLDSDPTLSQFSQGPPTVPISRTQLARRFADILPAHSLTRFLSVHSIDSLRNKLQHALTTIGVQVLNLPTLPGSRPAPSAATGNSAAGLPRGSTSPGPTSRGISSLYSPLRSPPRVYDSHGLGPRQEDSVTSVDERPGWLKIRTRDTRHCRLSGEILIERIASLDTQGMSSAANGRGKAGPASGAEVNQVVFVKTTGDPIEWRRLFKRVVLLLADVVLKPET